MRSLSVIGTLVFSSIVASPAAAQAVSTFNIQLDNQGLVFDGDGPLTTPIAGTGTFTSPFALGPGTYALSSLAGFSVNLTFANGDTYSTADITTPLDGAAVNIVDLGGSERLFFTESGALDSDGGTSGGALDFANSNGTLTLEPSYAGGNYLYFETGEGSGSAGRYLATGAVPEPATWAMMLLGFGGIGFAMRRKRSTAPLAQVA